MFTAAFIAQHPEASSSFNYDIINSALTDLDKAYMVINYPRTQPHPDAPEWTLAHALDVAGVDPRTKQRILNLHAQGDITTLRTTFNMWNALMQSDRESNNLPGVAQVNTMLRSYAEIANNIVSSKDSA